MEIIHLILGKANPNRMNGVNKVVNSLATYQTALGHEAKVWGIANDQNKNYPERNYETALFLAKRQKLCISKRLTDSIKQVAPDAVFHLHGGFIPEFYHCANAITKAGGKFVFTPHGAYNTIAMNRSKTMKKWYYRFFEDQVTQQAHAIHCIGQSEIEATQGLTNHANCVLIPNGQNLAELEWKGSANKHIDEPIFGFCGRLDSFTKGLDLLLEGFAEFIRQGDGKGQLWIVGDSAEMDQLKQLAKQLQISEKVTFWGKKFGVDKLAILSQMDVFFHPSRNEGLPGAVLEAAGLQIPCVVSKASNMADYIEEYKAGIALEENTAQEIAKSMHTMTAHKQTGDIKKIQQNAHSMVKKAFSWNTIAQQLVSVYQA